MCFPGGSGLFFGSAQAPASSSSRATTCVCVIHSSFLIMELLDFLNHVLQPKRSYPHPTTKKVSYQPGTLNNSLFKLGDEKFDKQQHELSFFYLLSCAIYQKIQMLTMPRSVIKNHICHYLCQKNIAFISLFEEALST